MFDVQEDLPKEIPSDVARAAVITCFKRIEDEVQFMKILSWAFLKNITELSPNFVIGLLTPERLKPCILLIPPTEKYQKLLLGWIRMIGSEELEEQYDIELAHVLDKKYES